MLSVVYIVYTKNLGFGLVGFFNCGLIFDLYILLKKKFINEEFKYFLSFNNANGMNIFHSHFFQKLVYPSETAWLTLGSPRINNPLENFLSSVAWPDQGKSESCSNLSLAAETKLNLSPLILYLKEL